MANIFFVSDMHFGHKNIIEYCNRPYTQVETMDEELIQNWNKTVNSDDTVYHLGDWAFNNYECIGQLNGNIISIPGNHDHERVNKLKPYLANGFTEEVHYLTISRDIRFVLCHYPFEFWRREYQYHLHGHAHGTADVKTNRLDVGIDATKAYRPLHLDEVLEAIKTNNLWASEMNK